MKGKAHHGRKKRTMRKRKTFGKRKHKRTHKRAALVDNAVVTYQRDSAVVYKRSGHRRRSARQSKFVKRVQDVINKNSSTITHVVNTSNQNQTGAGSQGCFDMSLFGIFGQSSEAHADVAAIFSELTATTAGALPVPGAGTKLQFVSANMDMYFTNVSSPYTVICLDVYVLTPKRDIYRAASGSSFTNAQQMLGYYLANTTIVPNPLGGTGSPNYGGQPSFSTPGVGPFDSPQFQREFTVLEKRRFTLQLNQTVSFNMKAYPKRHGPQAWNNFYDTGAASYPIFKKGWSKIVLYTFFALDETLTATTTPAGTYPTCAINVVTHKQYRVKQTTAGIISNSDYSYALGNYSNPQ